MAKKPAKKKSTVKSRKKSAKAGEELSRGEVAMLGREAQQQKRAEQSWQTLTGAVPDLGAGRDDSWSKVEEKLIKKPDASAHSERRWKYFSK